MALDRNADNSQRLRRNAQRGRSSGTTSAVKVVAPLQNTGTQIQLLLLSTGGITTNTGSLTIKLNTNPGLALAAGGLSVSLQTNPGLVLGATGLAMQLADATLKLAAGGVSVQLNAAGAITNNTGLQVALTANGGLAIVTNALGVKLDGTSLQLGVNGLGARGFYAVAPGSPADGDAWYDTTAKCVTFRQDATTQKMGGLLDVTLADSANVANTLVVTTVYTFTFPAAFFTVGKGFYLDFQGEYSTDPTAAAPAILIQANLAGVDLADSGIVTLPQNATNFRFDFSGEFFCRTTGNPATFGRTGGFIIELGASGTSNYFRPAGGAVFSGGDTSGTIALTITIGWGTALATNTAHLHQVILRAAN